MEKENEPPIKKRRLSLKSPSHSRFLYKSKEELETISKGFVPPNTAKNTRWARNCFLEWMYERNGLSDEQCPENILEEQCAADLNTWIPKFIAEARRSDGEPYTPKTIHQILSGLLRYMRSIKDDCPNILDKSDPRFRAIQRTCEFVYRSLHKEGVGVQVHHAPLISIEEEDQLWQMNILNVSEPKGLHRAVFYYVGKVCCLRGGEEQRNLKVSQFIRSRDPDMYTYVENGSKNRTGGLAQLNLENKIVQIHSVPENKPRCLVFLLDLYFSKLPGYAFESDTFYLRPKAKPPACPSMPWFDPVPVGKNKLFTVMKELSMEAGFKEKKTNHSLRATGATALFNAGVPEKMIQKNTGHRSLEALRKYERVSVEQQQATSRILTTLDQNTSFSRELETVANSFDCTAKDEDPSVKKENGFPLFHGCSIGQISIQFN